MVNHFLDTMSEATLCKFNRCLSTRLTPMGGRERTLQPSPIKNNNLRSVTAASTVWDSGSIGFLLVWQSRPSQVILICDFRSSIQNFACRDTFRPLHLLPSKSTSRWTPLPSANASCYRAHSGFSPPRYCQCLAHQNKWQ